MANLIRRRSASPISRVWRDVEPDPLSVWDDLLSPRTLRRQIDQLFDDFFSSSPVPAMGLGSARAFVPSLELTESGNEYVMNAELPGMTEKDIQLEVDDNNCLTIRGEKKSETSESRGGYDYSERSYGQFTRTVQLPSNTDASSIQASFENGVLELHVPKIASANVRSIPIGKGESKQMGASTQEQEPGGNGSGPQEKKGKEQQQQVKR
jgi:HSP20 family protein